MAGLLTLGLGADLARPPAEQWSAAALLGAVHLYQHTLSPAMPWMGVQCRFTPTCSHYAEGAIAKDGALIGSLRAIGRILRCGPWTPQGTVDPPRLAADRRSFSTGITRGSMGAGATPRGTGPVPE